MYDGVEPTGKRAVTRVGAGGGFGLHDVAPSPAHNTAMEIPGVSFMEVPEA